MAINKSRYWVGVLYPENMVDNWQDLIGDIVQVPFAYCIHDKDLDKQGDLRKAHIHLILAFSNTTTYKHALNVFQLLSKPDVSACNTIQAVVSIRSQYDYLIHNTEGSRKAQKHLYEPSERVIGNNFDIGSYEQLSVTDKQEILIELTNIIREQQFVDYATFIYYVLDNLSDDSHYFEIAQTHCNFFSRICMGNYQKWEREQLAREACDNAELETESVAESVVEAPESVESVAIYDENNTENNTSNTENNTSNTENNTSNTENNTSNTENNTLFCTDCGSTDLKKNGKTAGGTQRWCCKDCGKVFTV